MAKWVLLVQGAVLAALIGIVYAPALGFMVDKWRYDGDWSHGWLVPLFSIYFLAVHRDQLARTPRRVNPLGLLMILASLAVYYYFYMKSIAYPQRLSLVPLLMGLVLFMFGWKVLQRTWFPIAYLFMAIPLPATLYFKLTLPLRQLASSVAGALLNLLPDVYTQVRGVVVEYDHLGRVSALNVEEACSGMRLMMAFCSLGVAMAYLGDRPVWQRLIMVLCCVPIAVFCNMIRVFVTGVLHVYGYQDLSQGSAHALLGLAMLPIALGLFSLAGWILQNLVVDAPEEEAEHAVD